MPSHLCDYGMDGNGLFRQRSNAVSEHTASNMNELDLKV